MIRQLDFSDYSKVYPLFSSMEESQPMVAAVLEGIYPGKVFTADGAPSTALLTTYIESEENGIWAFLAGDPSDHLFINALNKAIYTFQVIPQGTPIVLFTTFSQEWDLQMDAILAPRPVIWMQRWKFVCRKFVTDWRAALPTGFSIQRLDESMLSLSDMQLPSDVNNILKKWQNFAGPDFNDYGFLILDEREDQPIVAAWATVDFVTRGTGDIGFFTQPKYRRIGLGTVVASASLVHGLKNGLNSILWTCDAGNQGSIQIAKKLGLERLNDYEIAMLLYNEGHHLATLAYYKLHSKEYSSASEIYRQAFAIQQAFPNFVHFEAAQAFAMSGDKQGAFQYLSNAVDFGWKDIEEVQTCEEFESLRGHPQWQEILSRM